MKISIRAAGLLAASAAVLLTASAANAVVIGFDDLSGSGVVPTIFHGIDFSDNFLYYDSPQDPYNPESAPERIYSNYAIHAPGALDTLVFSVGAGSVFDGLYEAGAGNGTVEFDLYDGAALVASSASVVSTSTPTFLASGYSGPITSVHINAINGYTVYDDLTFTTLVPIGVPEPATWAMMLVGAGLAGASLRRRRQSSVSV